jgi:hypothetical protein
MTGAPASWSPAKATAASRDDGRGYGFRALHAKWEHDARAVVASLRMEAAKDPDDPELAILVGELSVQDADFREPRPGPGADRLSAREADA